MSENDLHAYTSNLNSPLGFKFFFGLGNLDDDFDILDNEYVRFVGYNMYSDDGIETLNETYTIINCPPKTLEALGIDSLIYYD